MKRLGYDGNIYICNSSRNSYSTFAILTLTGSLLQRSESTFPVVGCGMGGQVILLQMTAEM